jgi:hypothetical protein
MAAPTSDIAILTNQRVVRSTPPTRPALCTAATPETPGRHQRRHHIKTRARRRRDHLSKSTVVIRCRVNRAIAIRSTRRTCTRTAAECPRIIRHVLSVRCAVTEIHGPAERTVIRRLRHIDHRELSDSNAPLTTARWILPTPNTIALAGGPARIRLNPIQSIRHASSALDIRPHLTPSHGLASSAPNAHKPHAQQGSRRPTTTTAAIVPSAFHAQRTRRTTCLTPHMVASAAMMIPAPAM